MACTTDTQQLESYITNECSQRIREQRDNQRSTTTATPTQERATPEEQTRLYRVIQSQCFGNGTEGDGRALRRQKGSRQTQRESSSEPLPEYKKLAGKEKYDDCGCTYNPNPVQKLVKRVVTKPEYLVNALGVHVRNPLHETPEQSQKRPPQKLSKKISQAKKDAKKARKDATKTKKKARKAMMKAQKAQDNALKTRSTIQDARKETTAATQEADMAYVAHVGAMRWATSVSKDAQGIREETRNALAQAKEFSKNSDYCDHQLV